MEQFGLELYTRADKKGPQTNKQTNKQTNGRKQKTKRTNEQTNKSNECVAEVTRMEVNVASLCACELGFPPRLGDNGNGQAMREQVATKA